MAKSQLTQEYVRSLFHYDPETGVLTWTHGRRRGHVAGAVERDGYIRVGVNRKSYQIHSVIWLFVYGEWPDELDHINRRRADNRLSNLRCVSHVENMRNQGLRTDNNSGVRGVHWCRTANKWIAQIKVSGKSHHVGRFDDKRLAIMARQNAEKEIGYL